MEQLSYINSEGLLELVQQIKDLNVGGDGIDINKEEDNHVISVKHDETLKVNDGKLSVPVDGDTIFLNSEGKFEARFEGHPVLYFKDQDEYEAYVESPDYNEEAFCVVDEPEAKVVANEDGIGKIYSAEGQYLHTVGTYKHKVLVGSYIMFDTSDKEITSLTINGEDFSGYIPLFRFNLDEEKEYNIVVA